MWDLLARGYMSIKLQQKYISRQGIEKRLRMSFKVGNKEKKSCSETVKVICQINCQKGVKALQVDQAPVVFLELEGLP